MTEGKLGVLAVLNRNAKHALEERQQVPLRWRHDRSRDLRLLPENLPVVLLRRPHAVQLRPPRPGRARETHQGARTIHALDGRRPSPCPRAPRLAPCSETTNRSARPAG